MDLAEMATASEAAEMATPPAMSHSGSRQVPLLAGACRCPRGLHSECTLRGAASLVVAVFAAAVTVSPAAAEPGSTGSALIKPPLHVLGFELEKATFAAVTKKMGPTKVQHNGGDAGDSAHVACYLGADGARLLFYSNDEMAGGDHISRVQLTARADSKLTDGLDAWDGPQAHRFEPTCASSTAVNHELAMVAGVHLGLTRSALERVLGNPSDTLGSASRWYREVPAGQAAGSECTTGAMLIVIFEGGTVAGIEVAQVTSC